MELRGSFPLLAAVTVLAFSGCAHLGFGPSFVESRSDLLTSEVVHRRFQEPPLESLGSDAAAIRITWKPTFDSPFLVRLDRRADGKATETIKQLSGMGGYTPGYLTQKRKREVSAQRFDILLRKLEASGFWTAPSAEKDSPSSLDGPTITVEAWVQGHYHSITRYAPGDNPREDKLVQFLSDAVENYTERSVIRLPWL